MVALARSQVRYTSDLGLELGIAGQIESPVRKEAEKRALTPFHKEKWSARTAQAVARRAAEFWAGGGSSEGSLMAAGFERYAVGESIRMAALLHDLGKLQAAWQQWAQAYQCAVTPDYDGGEFLAHTDFDPLTAWHRSVDRNVQPKRPPHAAASAYYTAGVLPETLGEAGVYRDPWCDPVASRGLVEQPEDRSARRRRHRSAF